MANSPDNTNYRLNSPRVGLGSVGSYQMAGTPFLTGSAISSGQEIRVDFPNVTKSITVANRDTGSDDIRIHFASKDQARTIAGSHFFTLTPSGSVTLDVKCRSIFISAPGNASKFELIAELTGIDPRAMFALTGSGIDQ